MEREKKIGQVALDLLAKIAGQLRGGNPAQEGQDSAAGATVDPDQPDLAAEDRPPERQYCIFRAGRERFCLSVLDVEEVVEWPTVTKMPLAPAFLMGIFNLRGSIIPVVDIAFSEAKRGDFPPKQVVVAALDQGHDQEIVRLGIAADEVIGTFSTAEPLLVHEAPRDVPHCCGMLRHEDRLALALDLRRLTQAFPVPVI